MNIRSISPLQNTFLLLFLASAVLIGQLLTYLKVTEISPSFLGAIEDRAVIQVSLIKDIRSQSQSHSRESILDGYLQDVRRDGPAAHAATKAKIDRLASNTEALLALLDTYAPAAQPGPLKKSADDFRRYANVWLDHKNHIMDLYLLGGNFPPGEPEFPSDLLQALKKSE